MAKCNKLVQLVVQVLYHVNVIHSLGGARTHTHTDFADKAVISRNQTRALAAIKMQALEKIYLMFVKNRDIILEDPKIVAVLRPNHES